MTKQNDPETSESTENSLRGRTLRSFIVFGLAVALGAGGWVWLRGQPLEDDIPRPLRVVLEWNGGIWHSLFSAGREFHPAPPPPRKKPRYNGNFGLESELDLAKWHMTVESEGADETSTKSLDLKMADMKLLPRTETTSEFKCIEGWSDVIAYAGVRFSDFLKQYRLGTHSGAPWDPSHPPADTYRYVGLETPDGEYYVSIDMESMLHPQTLLAYEMNGMPLDSPNGAPLRLIIPVKYGIKSLKRVGRIFFSDKRPPDYWAEQGYDWFAGL